MDKYYVLVNKLDYVNNGFVCNINVMAYPIYFLVVYNNENLIFWQFCHTFILQFVEIYFNFFSFKKNIYSEITTIT